MFDYCSKTEAGIAKALVRKALKAGYFVSVYDGEETALHMSANETVIFEAMNSTDMDVLTFWMCNGDDTRKVGQVALIWGNEDDLVSDWSDNVEIDAIVNFQG